MSAAGAGPLVSHLLGTEQLLARPLAESVPAKLASGPVENGVKVSFKITGASKSLTVDSRMTLLDTVRERLELTGSKKGKAVPQSWNFAG